MINLKETLEKIDELTGIRLRVGVCLCLEYTENPGGSWSDPVGRVYDSALHLPPFESDMRLAFKLMEKHGLALIPQSDEEHGWRWLCTDVNAVAYGKEIRLEEKESTGFGNSDPCIAICRCFLASELVIDWVSEQNEQANQQG